MNQMLLAGLELARFAAVAWHLPKFCTSPLAPLDCEILNTNWHPQSSFFVTSGTLSFKFLTQALVGIDITSSLLFSLISDCFE